MSKTIKITYCNSCNKEIPNPIVKQMDTMEKSIWFILILATLGFGLIPFLIYYYLYIKKRKYCPKCNSKLALIEKLIELPKEISEPITPKEKVLEKVEKIQAPEKKLEVEEKSFCQYCSSCLSMFW